MKKINHIFSNLLIVLRKPFIFFDYLRKEEVSLKPLLVVVFGLAVISLLSTLVLRVKVMNIVVSDLNKDAIAHVLSIDYTQYFIQILLLSLYSILMVSIITFIMSTLSKSNLSFKQNIILVSYSWAPMILASILTLLFLIIVNSEKALMATGLFSLIIPKNLIGTKIINLLNIFDPFYFWTLFLLATGMKTYFHKGKKIWYIITFLIFGLPLLFSFL